MAALAVVMGTCAERIDFGLPKMLLFILESSVLMGGGMLVDYNFNDGLDLLSLLMKAVILCAAFMFFIFPYRKDFVALIIGVIKKERE